ncbi:MAG: 4Fe-4S dicluster domain-containing protein [Candidatus Latescibacterota bacterium]
MDDLTQKLREAVGQLFAEDKIDLFIGYEKGSLPLTSTPCFIRSKDEVSRLIWDPFCSNNLSVYLPRYFVPNPRDKEQKFPRVGIMAKGCDGRNLVVISNEKQAPRSNLTIVGIACEGVMSKDKLSHQMDGKEIAAIRVDGSKVVLTDEAGREVQLEKELLLADPCLACEDPVPSVLDMLIGERSESKKGEDHLVAEFAALGIEERRAYFEEEMAKCIRCKACRQACPLCYCKECFADQIQPKWLGAGNALSDVMLFHLGRMFHTAGRCVDCGSCARACPMGVDLRRFQKQLVEAAMDRFEYKPGLSLDETAPLASFHLEDEQGFITKPE